VPKSHSSRSSCVRVAQLLYDALLNRSNVLHGEETFNS
jgi:hypothetical protein